MGHRVCVLLLVGALTGCAGDPAEVGAPPPPSEPSPSATTSRCENREGGYALTPPSDWFVAEGADIEPCTFFDPRPLALEPGTEATGVAIRADVRDVPLEQARRDAGGQQEVRRAGVRATGTYSDDALLPPGTAFTTWLIALGDRTLLLTTDAASGADHAAVLDEMAGSVDRL